MKNDDIQDLTTVAKDKAHSDADFMAEIDEQMNEIKSSPKKKSGPSNPPSHKASEDFEQEEKATVSNPPSHTSSVKTTEVKKASEDKEQGTGNKPARPLA